MFTINTQNDGGRAVVMAMLGSATNKTHNSALDSLVLAGEEKKKSTLSHILTGEK